MPLSTHAAPMTSGTTGKDGLAAVVPEAEGPWWLVVDAPGAGPLLRRVEAEDAARGTVVEVRPGAGRIAGRAVRLDGSAARVRLGFTVTVPMPHGTSSLRTSQGTVETDAEGRFTFVGVHDGVSGLQTVTPGFRVVPTPGETFSSHAEDLRVLVVDEAEAAGLTLEVEVLDGATGEALTVRPDVRLRRAGDPGYAPAFSTPGRRSVHRSQDALATGPWEVEVHAEGYVTAKSEAHVAPGPAATRVVVRMERSR
jgi:hypothetical protein